MVAEKLLDETAPAGLKVVIGKYFPPMSGYADALQNIEGVYEKLGTVPLTPQSDFEASFAEGFGANLLHYAVGDVDATLRVMEAQWPLLMEQDLLDTMKHECQKIELCHEMEFQGDLIDWPLVESLNAEWPEILQEKQRVLESFPVVRRMFPTGYNPGSPVQTRKVLFEGFQIIPLDGPEFRTAKGELSVGADALAEYARTEDPEGEAFRFIEAFREFSKAKKLFSAFISRYPDHRCEDDRIHPKYNTTTVVTWRLSSSDPNKQQLPKAKAGKTGRGSGDVKAVHISHFPGGFLLEADYAQMELRVAAILSQDPAMISGFRQGGDYHTATASKVFGVPYEQVTEDQRQGAKAINFGIIYGMGAQALARRLRVSVYEAETMLEDYFAAFPFLTRWLKKVEENVEATGYVCSLFGHRRRLPDAKGFGSGALRAKRQAANAIIQCTAANLTLKAAWYLMNIFREEGLRSVVFGQVHDSIQVSGPAEELDQVAGLVKTVMENLPMPWLNGAEPYPHVCPLAADLKAGKNLRDLEPYAVKDDLVFVSNIESPKEGLNNGRAD
jgi:DNA polymerase-1